MIFSIDNLLTAENLAFISDRIDNKDFIDGKKTAGWHAKTVKENTQLSPEVNYSQAIKDLIRTALIKNPLFKAATQPKAIHSMLISRYESGMSYGKHVDNAIMGRGAHRYRSDISFTVFLNDPNSYEGGELAIENTESETEYKLAAGSAIVYPSNKLHEVKLVTKGIRLVAVGWVHSFVRDPNKREILFDLDTVKRSLFQKQGNSIEFNLLSKTHSNLLRQWSEV